MAGYTNKLKLTLWVFVVYVLSFICYVPALLERLPFKKIKSVLLAGVVWTVAIMHATFNICYLAPIQYNIVVLAIIIFAGTLWYKKSDKKFFT